MGQSHAVVLLDVDGVVNPRWSTTAGVAVAEVDEARQAQILRLAEIGEVVWATTTPPDLLIVLNRVVGFTGNPRAVTMASRDPGAPTPKLRPVQRWVHREDADRVKPWFVVWIDDQFRSDAMRWAESSTHPRVLLVHVDPAVGLTSAHVDAVRQACSTPAPAMWEGDD